MRKKGREGGREGGTVADGYTVGRARNMSMRHLIKCDLRRMI